MSYPDRKFDRPFQSRRNHQPYESPFRRARLDDHAPPDVDPSRIPSPSSKYGARPRKGFGQTRTLRGAYEAASRTTTMADDGERPTPPMRSAGRTPSPRGRRERNLSMSAPSPASDVSSPPGELLETYRRINDADNLIDLVEQDEFEYQQEQLRGDRLRRLSPAHSMKDSRHEGGDAFEPDLSYLDEVTDDSLRARLVNHARDEQRLKRVTARESPVFSKAKVGIKASLSAENLQRRDAEEEEQVDNGLDPTFNLPRSWSTRGRTHRDRLSTLSRRNGDTPKEEQPEQVPVIQGWEPDIDFTARSLQVSDSPPLRKTVETRVGTETSTEDRFAKSRQGDLPKKPSPEKKQPSLGGSPIPNSPVVVYKDSSRSKPAMTKSDSQELLRRLARTESPPQTTPQTSTPEAKPSDKRLLDKTPVVTGAWVDTPMTERATELPEDLTKDIVSPSKSKPKSEDIPQKPEKQPEPKQEAKQEAKQPEQKKVKKKLELIKPKLPKSALETVIEDAKSEGHPLTLGDDTINSLQEIIDQEPTFLKTEDEDSALDDKAGELELEELKTFSGKEAVVLDRLNGKLRSLVQSIHEARKGLSSLEDQVSKDTIVLSTAQAGRLRHGPHDANEICEACGAHTDGRLYLPISIPHLWRREPVSNRVHPTRLGWFTLILITWFWSESVMCDYYCHPLIAEVCDRNCLTPDAPRFPFVLLTMLWRWSHLSTILSPLYAVLIACTRLIAQLLGLWDGYWDDSSSPQTWGLSGFGNIGVHGISLRDIPVVANIAPDHHAQSPRATTGPSVWQKQGHSDAGQKPIPNWSDDGLTMEEDEYL